MTLNLLKGLHIDNEKDVVEFAPGIGYTAGKVLEKNPKSYTGIELNEEAAARLQKTINGANRQIIIANAESTPLPDDSADIVIGEAMLTMHVNDRKSLIIKEAHRILRKGGLYGIHELGLRPDSIADTTKVEIQKTLSKAIHVNARPQTEIEWRTLLEEQGFEIVDVFTSRMLLLEASRVIDDEGLLRSIKIGYNILRDGPARRRILEMRSVFRKYEKEMSGIALIARKK